MLVHADWPSQLTLYTESIGTVSATHCHRYCHFVQFYAYHKNSTGNLQYDNWMKVPYYFSSQKTGIETAMLRCSDSELFIGQILYKRRADI